jgi:hypothetical protein
MYLGHENVIILVTKYDENLLLPLLMEANKLLMFNRANMAFDLHSQVDYEGFFHIKTTINTYMDILSWELLDFDNQIFLVQKLQICIILMVQKKKHKFPTIVKIWLTFG